MSLIEYALQYAGRGWHVFPLRPRAKLPLLSKKSGGKGFHDATSDPGQVTAWWSRAPQANIGLATGASGLVVLDADGPAGLAQLKELAAPHGGLLRTLTARTGREGGFHLYYRGTGIASWQDNRKGDTKQWHFDIRGSTGYVILPPSIHPSGAQYAWVDAAQPIAEAPAWLGPLLASLRGSVHTAAAGNPARDTETLAALSPSAPSSRTVPAGSFASGRGLAARSVANLSSGPAFSESEADRLFSALSAIDAATDGATWASYGAALHDLKWIVNGVDEGFEIFDEWSSTSTGKGPGNGEYKGRADLEKRWVSFDKEYNGVRKTIASIYKDAMDRGWQYDPTPPQEQKVNGNHSLEVLPPTFQQAAFASPIIWPDRDQWGRPKATCRNARAAIRHMGLTCEHDRFHDKLIIGGQAIEQWAGELTDNTTHMLRVTIAQRYNLDPGNTNTFDAAVQECLQDSFDPVADYLDGLTWDGVPRLRTWLATYMGAADTPLNAAIGGLILIAAVRRVRQPGCKFDQILVLEGPEGRGKSSAIEILAGQENFSDQTILTADDKGQQEAISGVWLYEIADLAGMSKADTEKVKAFCSRTVDRARPAYGRTRQDKPRRCVFIATTNHATFLKSQTGNRRFWPVQTGRVDLEALRRDRDQLWAEANAIERRGVSLFLPEGLWQEAAAIQDARRDADPWEDILADVETHKATSKKPAADGHGMEYRITSRDVLETVLRLPLDKLNDVTAKRAALALRRLGWDGPKPLRSEKIVAKGFTKKAEDV